MEDIDSNDKTLTEDLIKILKDEIIVQYAYNWRPNPYGNNRKISDESIEAYVFAMCLELRIKNIYDLPKSRFWEAILFIKGHRISK